MSDLIYENENLKQVQECLLEIMDEIHSICINNGIVYYLLGGSALGAVRHKGFIPWDMDIDIGMPRKDYEKFADVCKSELSLKLKYVDFKSVENYYMPHALVIMQDTTIYLSPDYYRIPKQEHVLVDIFPLDCAPDEENERQKQKKELQRLSKIQSRKECILYKRNTPIEIAVKKFIQFGLKLTYPIKKVNSDQDKVMRRFDAMETKCICSMASQYAYEKQCMEREIYGNPRLMEFSGRLYYVPEQTERYLTRIYGKNFMSLPPIEKRYRPNEYIAKFELKKDNDN